MECGRHHSSRDWYCRTTPILHNDVSRELCPTLSDSSIEKAFRDLTAREYSDIQQTERSHYNGAEIIIKCEKS